MNRILIVDDDTNLRQQLADYLTKQNYHVTSCASFAKALTLDMTLFDLVILDWNLGDGEGVDLVKHWRGKGCRLPVIMLTARADVVDRVVGLEIGSQDYVTKPYDPRELLARIRAHTRSFSPDGRTESQTLEAAGVRLDLSSREARIVAEDRAVELTKMEFDLLALLLRGAGKVFTREELLNRVWGFDSSAETRTVDAHVFKIRQKFSEGLIETVRGLGYRVKRGPP